MSSSAITVVPAMHSMIYLGVDVHKDSITIAVLPEGAKSPTRLDRLPNDLPKLKRWLDRMAKEGEIRACYEASGAGYVLHSAMKEWGYKCEVIAPSLIPKRPGVQRKHDKRDAADLARYYRAGELTVVRIPSESDERVRDGDRTRLGSITKAGNSHCRHVPVQAAWSYRHRPQTGVELKRRQQGQSPAVIVHAWKANSDCISDFITCRTESVPRSLLSRLPASLSDFSGQ